MSLMFFHYIRVIKPAYWNCLAYLAPDSETVIVVHLTLFPMRVVYCLRSSNGKSFQELKSLHLNTEKLCDF